MTNINGAFWYTPCEIKNQAHSAQDIFSIAAVSNYNVSLYHTTLKTHFKLQTTFLYRTYFEVCC